MDYLNSSLHRNVNGAGFIQFDDLHFERIGTRLDALPNADFEAWNNIGVEYPEGWLPIDLRAYDYWNTFLPDTAVTKSEDAYSGSYSAKISNYNSWGSPGRGYFHLGNVQNHSWRPSIAIQESFKYIEGYYKYYGGESGLDSGQLQVRTFLGSGQRTYNMMWFEPKSEWTYFYLPISYRNEDDVVDSATVIFYATGTEDVNSIESYLQIDDLKFVNDTFMETITVLGNKTNSLFQISPNPAIRK